MQQKLCVFIAEITSKDVTRDLCTPQYLLDIIKKIEVTGCICDKPRSGRSIVSEIVVTKVHHIVTSGHMQTAGGTARVLDTSKTTALKLLHSVLRMFPYQYHIVAWRPTTTHRLCK